MAEFGEGVAKPRGAEALALAKKHHTHAAGRNKFNAQKTLYNGVLYDSKKEAEYAAKFDTLRKAAGKDKVVKVERQIEFPFIHNEVKICKYVCDFRLTMGDGRIRYLDIKGFETREFSIKRKLLKAFYGIEIEVI